MTYEPYPKRDPIKNYFPLPNELFHLGLNASEVAIYCYLVRCEDRTTYQCHPGYETIGNAVGLSRNTVRKYVHSLEEKGFIRTERTSVVTKKGEKRNGTLCYTILPIEGVKLHELRRQIRNAQEERKRREVQQVLETLSQERDDACRAELSPRDTPEPRP